MYEHRVMMLYGGALVGSLVAALAVAAVRLIGGRAGRRARPRVWAVGSVCRLALDEWGTVAPELGVEVVVKSRLDPDGLILVEPTGDTPAWLAKFVSQPPRGIRVHPDNLRPERPV